jgi:endonuclease/exonuclease/phosphatase family metal-dependent hydrolase
MFRCASVCLVVLSALSVLRAEEAPPTPPVQFTVATYNINWGNTDLKGVAKSIREAKADLVALQETNEESEQFLRRSLAAEYPHTAFRGGYMSNGFGLLSKVPIENPKYVEPKFGFFGAWLAEVTLAGMRLQIANVHLEPAVPEDNDGVVAMFKLFQKMEDVHGKEIRRIHENLSDKLPVLVMGDFNSSSTLSAPQFLKEKGFVDSFAAVTEKADEQVTWHWKRKGFDWHFRIDYIFHSKQFQTVESRIIKSEASDHYLTVSKLKWAPAENPKPEVKPDAPKDEK